MAPCDIARRTHVAESKQGDGATLSISGNAKRSLSDARWQGGPETHAWYTRAAIESRREARELLRVISKLIGRA
jgi:hypothetical protein